MAFLRRFALSVALLAATFVSAHANAQSSPFFVPGNLVVVVEGCGVQGASCTVTGGTGTGVGNSSVGGYGDNQAAPLTLFQFKPTGTSSASYVNALVLPQTASGGNLPLAGEYGSSSEASVQLSGAGQYLTLMGYGINAATFNAAPATYGAAPSLALAQSGSLTGQSYTPIARVVVMVDPNGNVNASTPIYNVFNNNNPRSIYTADGLNAYISGQGNSPDATGGVFYTPLGALNNTPTPITGLDTNSNTSNEDTRNVQIYNGTLYVSVDSREGSGSNRSFVGTLGNPPAVSLFNKGNGPTQLNTSNNASKPTAVTSTGKLVLTASETNGLNAAGQTINLSPSEYFFANASTLYVADTGNGKQTSASTTLGDGGLQKWVNTKADGTGTWQLVYTLAAGLNLVANPTAVPANTTGATGLYSVAGQVNGTTVNLYVVNYNISDLDTTYLYGITDTLADTTPPGTTFTQLAVAPSDSNFKGVSFAPTYPAGSATITSVPSGLTVTTAGTGCVPGTYVTPVTLVWTPGSTCTLTTTAPQTSGGAPYVFTQWQDNTISTTDTVVASATPSTYTATFTNNFQPVGAIEKAQDNTTASTNVLVGNSLMVSGWVADPLDGSPLTNVQVYVDGKAVGAPTLGISRPDIATTSGNPAYTNSGFKLVASTSALALGTHAVTVVAVDSVSHTTTLGPVNFNLVSTPVVNVAYNSIVFATPSTTLSATVAYTGSVAPAGAVSFTVNGGTTGVGAATCTGTSSPLNCTATYTSSTLPVGIYPVTATIAATSSYVTATGSATLIVTAATDFSFSASGSSTQIVVRGSSASFTFNLKPLFASYPGAVSFSVSGLPAGATSTFTPASVTSTGGAQTVTLAVQTSASHAANAAPSTFWKPVSGVFAAFCLLPVCFRRRMRSGLGKSLALLLLMCGSLGAVAGLAGCGAGTSPNAPTVLYTVTVTATSGGVQHPATVTLGVQ
ncbi:MAG TPA: hypothetical protein VGN16_15630 [Acidobacteriaceae bacterium]|jgi:hypothetical protein